MAKYSPLGKYLQTQRGKAIVLSFEEIEEIIGGKLPRSAHQYDWWWANEDVDASMHTHCIAWQNAGWRTGDVDRKRRLVQFVRG